MVTNRCKYGKRLKHPIGTKIMIPPNAFVDGNGNAVTGEVEIQYNDYRDVADFIFGGIPMSYLFNGKMYHFNSAGMFKILAYKNGIPVYLKKGEQINLDYEITEEMEDLNFYRFDDNTRQWEQVGELDGQNQNDNGANLGKSCGFVNGSKVCLMDDCEGLIYLFKKGLSLSSIANSNLTKFREISIVIRGDSTDHQLELDKIAQEINANNGVKDAISDVLDLESRYYKIRVVKEKKK